MTTKTERGMQMYSGTLTVLKRFTMGVLGVLGLSVLTTGQVSAQEIPAPDLFNDQVACSQAAGMYDVVTQSVVAMGAMTSALDDLLRGGAGMSPRPIDGLAGATTTKTSMFPTAGMAMPCGGSGALADNADAAAVGAGYAAVRTAYLDLVGKEEAQRVAQQNVDGAATPTAQQLKTLEDAKAATAKSQTALDAISMGPIYQAGIAEWRASDAIPAAITAWDAAVNDATTKEGTLNDADYLKYVAIANTGSTTLLDLLVDADGTLVQAQLNNFLGIDSNGNTVATVYHDESGALIVPMTGSGDDAVPTEVTADVGVIKANLDAANEVVTALEKAQANPDQLQRPRLAEALRRAKLIRDHQDTQYKAALAESTNDLEPAVEGTQSIATYNAAYQAAVGTRNTAETALRAAARHREQSTAAVKTQFQNAESFFDQLVARRMVEQTEAAKVVTDAGDAATEAQMEASADAAAAVAAAQATKANYERLTSDTDNPVTALVQELLKPETGDDAGDDGQALVDAIDTTYDKTIENAAAIEELVGTGEEDGDGGQVNENTAAIAALTDEDGPVTMNTENIAENKAAVEALTAEDGPVTMNTENIAANTDGVAANKEAVEALTAEDGPVTMNTDNIAANKTMIDANTEGVAANKTATETNADGVAANKTATETNADGVAANKTATETNADGVAANKTATETNADGVAANKTATETNADGVAANKTATETNADGVAANKTATETNAGMITTNIEGIAANKTATETNADGVAANKTATETNAEGIAANKTATETNADGVAANKTATETNADGIAANKTATETNASGIATNVEGIATNVEGIATNVTGIATNVTAIETNASGIATNVEGIATNVEGIATNVTGIATNVTAIETNASGIATNVEGIATNVTGIATNVTGIATNVTGIATNVTGIATNVEGIAVNKAATETNATGIATNVTDIATNAGNIMTNAGNIVTNAGNIVTNADGVAVNKMATETNAGNITMNAGGIATNASNITAAEVRIMANEGKITTNTGSIASNKSAIDANAASIGKLGNELRNDLDVVRAGVAASMALAGMPSLDGRGFAVGLGSFDGETAFAAGFLYSTDRASFKIGVTSSGGETGASVGGAWQF